MEKAERSLQAARLLHRDGDIEGVCNRAYYAMFYAAHVALLLVEAPGISSYKTHQGLVAAFGRHVILAGHMPADHGRSINEVQRIRELSDYLGDLPPPERADLALANAEAFVRAVAEAVSTRRSPS